MRVAFVARTGGPQSLICEAEIHFDDTGPLAGMKLVGFALWRGGDGMLFVTFPSRAFGVGSERRFFDYLRSAEGELAAVRRVKDWILSAYRGEPADSPMVPASPAASTPEARPARRTPRRHREPKEA